MSSYLDLKRLLFSHLWDAGYKCIKISLFLGVADSLYLGQHLLEISSEDTVILGFLHRDVSLALRETKDHAYEMHVPS